jgi:hypothetical protein
VLNDEGYFEEAVQGQIRELIHNISLFLVSPQYTKGNVIFHTLRAECKAILGYEDIIIRMLNLCQVLPFVRSAKAPFTSEAHLCWPYRRTTSLRSTTCAPRRSTR